MTNIETNARRDLSWRREPAQWLAEWDAIQRRYVPDRELTFDLIPRVITHLGIEPRMVLDLGCGPGGLANRVKAALPGARVVGVDFDPVLLELGRETVADGVALLDADLRRPGWSDGIASGTVDVVVSATALHYLPADTVAAVVAEAADTLRPGGVLVDFDTLLADPRQPRLAALVTELRLAEWEGAFDDDVQTWAQWWERLREEPRLAAAFAERAARYGDWKPQSTTTLADLEQALAAAGFAEHTVLSSHLDRRLVVAIR